MWVRWIWMLLVLVACTKGDPDGGGEVAGRVVQGMIVINEVVAERGLTVGELGEDADWFELYNPGPQDLVLAEGEWFVSDAGLKDPMRFELPELELPVGATQVIWCDKLNDASAGIHTNFALSAKGEHLVLYHMRAGQGTVVDEFRYEADVAPGPVAARYPDGAERWVLPAKLTPGTANAPPKDEVGP